MSFSKRWNCTSRFGECNFSFLKNSQEKKKKLVQKNCRKMFLEAIFSHSRNLFSEFPYKIFLTALHDIIFLQNFTLSFCQNHYPELRCVICTGVALFAPVLHFLHWCYTWTPLLSANQSRVIFSCADLPSLGCQFTALPLNLTVNQKALKLPNNSGRYYLTHIFDVSRFEVLISRFIWAFFSKPADLDVMGVGRSACVLLQYVISVVPN